MYTNNELIFCITLFTIHSFKPALACFYIKIKRKRLELTAFLTLFIKSLIFMQKQVKLFANEVNLNVN